MTKFDSIILTAGRSSRMGTDKAFVKYKNIPFIEHIIDKLLPISEKIYIVLGHNRDILRDKIYNLKQYSEDKFIFLENINYDNGMFSSIYIGLKNVSKERATLLHMIDQPTIPKDVYDKLFNYKFPDDHYIQPSFKLDNKILKGHPIVFGKNFIDLILDNYKLDNLRDILYLFQNKNIIIPVDTIRIKENINTPEKLEKLDQITL